MQSWDLFIDESGDFGTTDGRTPDTVVVGGVLVRRHDPRMRGEGLRRSLKWTLPFLPWPLHANRINQVVVLPIACAGHPKVDADTRRDAEEVVAWWSRSHLAPLARARDAVARGEYPDYADARALRAALRKQTKTWLRWQHRSEQVFGLLVAVARDYGAVEAPDALAPWTAIVAGEVAPRSVEMGERYADLLVAAVQRAVDLLGLGPRAELTVHPGGRHVRPGAYLTPSLVRAWVAAGVIAPAGVSIVIAPVDHADGNRRLDPRHVFADFVCNRAYQLLRGRPTTTLDEYAAGLEERTGHRVWTGTRRPRSHLAAGGAPFTWLSGARRGGGAPPQPPDERVWAWAQALTWRPEEADAT